MDFMLFRNKHVKFVLARNTTYPLSTPCLSSDWPHSTHHFCVIEAYLDHTLFTSYLERNSPILRMEAAYSSETSELVYNTKLYQFPGDYNLNNPSCGNLYMYI